MDAADVSRAQVRAAQQRTARWRFADVLRAIDAVDRVHATRAADQRHFRDCPRERLIPSGPKRTRGEAGYDDDSSDDSGAVANELWAWLNSHSKENVFASREISQVTILDRPDSHLIVIPDGIALLTALTELHLEGNRLTAMPNISTLVNLTVLGLGENQLTMMPDISALVKLTRLGLDQNQLKYPPPGLGALTALTELYLWNNRLTAMPDISALVNLTILDLSINRLTKPPLGLGKCTALTELVLFRNQLTEMPDISALINLTTLVLYDNRLIGAPVGLDKLTALTTLYLHGNQLTVIPDISALVNLTLLDLGANQLTEAPPGLDKLTTLTELLIPQAQLTAMPDISALVKLTRLCLAGNHLTEAPPGLDKLTALTDLFLSYNRLTAMPDISALVNVTVLRLASNRLTEAPPGLDKLTALTTLTLDNNRLVQVPNVFAGLTRLSALELNDNGLVVAPASLALLPQAQIDLSNNDLSIVPLPNHRNTSFSYNVSNNRLLPSFVARIRDYTPALFSDIGEQRPSTAEYWKETFARLSLDNRVALASLFIGDVTVLPSLFAALEALLEDEQNQMESIRAQLLAAAFTPAQAFERQVRLSIAHYSCINDIDPVRRERILPHDRLILYIAARKDAIVCFSRAEFVDGSARKYFADGDPFRGQKFVLSDGNATHALAARSLDFYIKLTEGTLFIEARSILRIVETAQMIFHAVPLFDGQKKRVGRVDRTTSQEVELYALVPAHSDLPEYVVPLPFPPQRNAPQSTR